MISRWVSIHRFLLPEEKKKGEMRKQSNTSSVRAACTAKHWRSAVHAKNCESKACLQIRDQKPVSELYNSSKY